jgi:uncharacterized membrane protein
MAAVRWPQGTGIALVTASFGSSGRGPRVAAVDLARGVAIVAMVAYHTAFDLSAFGLIATDVQGSLGWKIFARLIAGSFLFLVGVSLVLASRGGLDRRAFLRRVGFIAAGAALVTLGTWWFDPATFVYFGILHHIAVASVLAVPLLRLPSWAVALAAVAAFAAPHFLAHPVLNAPTLLWVGLATELPATVDYVPLLPWFGAVLLGILGGRLLVARGTVAQAWRPSDRVSQTLMRAGRWSLAIYLVHQPLIVGIISAVAFVLPPGEATIRANFTSQCETTCTAEGANAASCPALCGCMFESLYGTDLFATRSVDELSPEQMTRWGEIVGRCQAPPPP